MFRTLSYVYGKQEEIRQEEEYYFGELWDGNGDGAEILESGAVAVYDENKDDFKVVEFEIVESNENIMQTRVLITSFC